MVTVHVAGVRSAPVTADPHQGADLAARASLAPRVPPAAATREQVLQGRARTARAGTTPIGAHPGRVVSDPAPMARRTGRSAIEATPPGGRPVTGQQEPRATEPATGRRGQPAPAAATAPGAASTIGALNTAGATAGSVPAGAPGAATAPGAVTELGAVAAPGAATGPGAMSEPRAMSELGAAAGIARAPGAPGPGGTRRRPGRPARPGRSFRTRSLPSNWIPRRGPS
jgi:hypothetical protein